MKQRTDNLYGSLFSWNFSEDWRSLFLLYTFNSWGGDNGKIFSPCATEISSIECRLNSNFLDFYEYFDLQLRAFQTIFLFRILVAQIAQLFVIIYDALVFVWEIECRCCLFSSCVTIVLVYQLWTMKYGITCNCNH